MGDGLGFLVLMLTKRCPLSCQYCYLGEAACGHGKDHDELGLDMGRDVLIEAVTRLGPGRGPFRLQLSGGEPTLRMDLVRLAVEEARRLGRPVTASIQTNGVLLDRPMARELGRLSLQVGVSLDGPPEVNEALRGGTRELLRGLSFLEEAQVPFAATAVVTASNASKLHETAMSLSSFSQARGLGLDLLVKLGRGANGAAEPASPADLEAGAARLARAAASLAKIGASKLKIRELELVRRAFASGSPAHFCQASRGRGAAVRPDGAVFPCGQLAGEPSAQIGRLGQKEIFFEPSPRPDGLFKLGPLNPGPMASPECPSCPLGGRCPGDCPSRLGQNSELKPLACSLYRGLARADGLII